MNLDHVTSGRSLPDDFNVIIENPMNADPVKYESDKDTGALFVHRFMMSPTHYPCNCGYPPHSLSDDAGCVDTLLITPVPVTVGAVIRCRPVGILRMDDEAGGGAPSCWRCRCTRACRSTSTETGPNTRSTSACCKSTTFFRHWKDLESAKWVKVVARGGPEEARAEFYGRMGTLTAGPAAAEVVERPTAAI